jgi:hypothetical protein
VHPPPSPATTDFTLITECTPESSGCNSVYSVLTSFCHGSLTDHSISDAQFSSAKVTSSCFFVWLMNVSYSHRSGYVALMSSWRGAASILCFFYFRLSGSVALMSSQLGYFFIFPPLRFRGADELMARLCNKTHLHQPCRLPLSLLFSQEIIILSSYIISYL